MKPITFSIFLLTIVNTNILFAFEGNHLPVITAQPGIDDAPPSYDQAVVNNSSVLSHTPTLLAAAAVSQITPPAYQQEERRDTFPAMSSGSPARQNVSEIVPHESEGVQRADQQDEHNVFLENNFTPFRFKSSRLRERLQKDVRNKSRANLAVLCCCPCFVVGGCLVGVLSIPLRYAHACCLACKGSI